MEYSIIVYKHGIEWKEAPRPNGQAAHRYGVKPKAIPDHVCYSENDGLSYFWKYEYMPLNKEGKIVVNPLSVENVDMISLYKRYGKYRDEILNQVLSDIATGDISVDGRPVEIKEFIECRFDSHYRNLLKKQFQYYTKRKKYNVPDELRGKRVPCRMAIIFVENIENIPIEISTVKMNDQLIEENKTDCTYGKKSIPDFLGLCWKLYEKDVIHNQQRPELSPFKFCVRKPRS